MNTEPNSGEHHEEEYYINKIFIPFFESFHEEENLSISLKSIVKTPANIYIPTLLPAGSSKWDTNSILKLKEISLNKCTVVPLSDGFNWAVYTRPKRRSLLIDGILFLLLSFIWLYCWFVFKGKIELLGFLVDNQGWLYTFKLAFNYIFF